MSAVDEARTWLVAIPGVEAWDGTEQAGCYINPAIVSALLGEVDSAESKAEAARATRQASTADHAATVHALEYRLDAVLAVANEALTYLNRTDPMLAQAMRAQLVAVANA